MTKRIVRQYKFWPNNNLSTPDPRYRIVFWDNKTITQGYNNDALLPEATPTSRKNTVAALKILTGRDPNNHEWSQRIEREPAWPEKFDWPAYRERQADEQAEQSAQQEDTEFTLSLRGKVDVGEDDMSNTIEFHRVPVQGTTRGLSIPVPAMQTDMNKDRHADMPQRVITASIYQNQPTGVAFKRENGKTVAVAPPPSTQTRDIQPGQHYLAELKMRSTADGRWARKFMALQAVTENEWNKRVTEYEQELAKSGQRYAVNTQLRVDYSNQVVDDTNPFITDILQVPDIRPEFIPDPQLEDFCITLDTLAQVDGKPENGMVLGVTAAGKTFGIEQAAAKLGRLFVRIDMSKVGEIYDLVGPMLAVEENGTSVTKWVPSAFIKAIQDPRPKWILLDELNRTQSPHALNFLMPLLDDARRSYFDEGERWIGMDDKTVVFCTQNGDVRGNDTGDYVGTQPLDQAIVSRFPLRVQVMYPGEQKIMAILQRAAPALGAAEVKMIASVATELAKMKYQMPNLRELIKAAKLRQLGKSMYDSLKLTLGGLYPNNQTNDCPFMTFRATLQGKGITLGN